MGSYSVCEKQYIATLEHEVLNLAEWYGREPVRKRGVSIVRIQIIWPGTVTNHPNVTNVGTEAIPSPTVLFLFVPTGARGTIERVSVRGRNLTGAI